MGSGWMWPINDNGEAISAPIELKNVDVSQLVIACPGTSIPCPDFEEVTVETRPCLEITDSSDGPWVWCLTCSTWVMSAEGGTPAKVLEHAEETHECLVTSR